MKTRFQANTGLRRLTATVTDADVDDVELFELPRDAMVVGTLLGVQDAPAENATLKVGYKGGTETELVNAAAGETVTITEAVGAQQLVMPGSPVTTDRVRTIVATLSDKTAAAIIDITVLFALMKDTSL